MKILLCVTIAFALNDSSDSLSATHWYKVTPRVCLKENSNKNIITLYNISYKITNGFGVTFADCCGVRTDRTVDDKLLVGSNFDDERLFAADIRFELSDICLVYDDNEVERVWLLNKLELGIDWTPVDEVLLSDSKLLLELARI